MSELAALGDKAGEAAASLVDSATQRSESTYLVVVVLILLALVCLGGGYLIFWIVRSTLERASETAKAQQANHSEQIKMLADSYQKNTESMINAIKEENEASRAAIERLTDTIGRLEPLILRSIPSR